MYKKLFEIPLVEEFEKLICVHFEFLASYVN